MKRLSSKKRKLQYIREKNHYRLGGKLCQFFNVSNEIMKDVDSVECIIKNEGDYIVKTLERKFKMPFSLTNIETGVDSDDFINDTTTIKFTLKVTR